MFGHGVQMAVKGKGRMARDDSFAHPTNAPASTTNATRNRHYGFIRHYLFLYYLLSFGR
jgi:hypothetical protein